MLKLFFVSSNVIPAYTVVDCKEQYTVIYDNNSNIDDYLIFFAIGCCPERT